MDTKLRGDIAEQAIIFYALNQEWEVLTPIGDRLPYDLVIVCDGEFHRIQSKWSWVNGNGSWVIDPRRCKTNRKEYRIEPYGPDDFDFMVAYIAETSDFFILPIAVALSYASTITLIGTGLRQLRVAKYKNAWEQLCAG